MAKQAIQIIEDSVPILAGTIKPADTLDPHMLSHILSTVPKIEHPDPNKKKLPKDLDVLALLQDEAHFDVRSWEGILPRRTSLDQLQQLLHFHLVLPLAFPMKVVYLARGEEFVITSDQTLKASIADAIRVLDRSGRAQIALAVRRSPKPLFHTAVREQGALRLQSAWRMRQARRSCHKAKQRAFSKSLFLGRYLVDGLPDLCQHRRLVAHITKAHGLTQSQALHEVARRLERVVRRDPARRRCPDEAAAESLTRRIKPSEPARARVTVEQWMTQSRQMALHELFCAMPLPLSLDEQARTRSAGEERRVVRASEQEAVLQHAAELLELSQAENHRAASATLNSEAEAETEAERLRRSTREIQQLARHAAAPDASNGAEKTARSSPRASPSPPAPSHLDTALTLEDGEVGTPGQDASTDVDEGRGSDMAGMAARSGTPDELKGDWAGRALEVFDEKAIAHLDWCTATDVLAEAEAEAAAAAAVAASDSCLHDARLIKRTVVSVDRRQQGAESSGGKDGHAAKGRWNKAFTSLRAVNAFKGGQQVTSEPCAGFVVVLAIRALPSPSPETCVIAGSQGARAPSRPHSLHARLRQRTRPPLRSLEEVRGPICNTRR